MQNNKIKAIKIYFFFPKPFLITYYTHYHYHYFLSRTSTTFKNIIQKQKNKQKQKKWLTTWFNTSITTVLSIIKNCNFVISCSSSIVHSPVSTPPGTSWSWITTTTTTFSGQVVSLTNWSVVLVLIRPLRRWWKSIINSIWMLVSTTT